MTGPKVLVLEDDAVTAKAYDMLLRPFGCEVKTAPHIEPAMRLCSEGWPDVIILDIQLPLEDISGVGCWDGLDFLKWLRTMVPNSPPVFVVSVHSKDAMAQAMAFGAAGYFQKPISKIELATAVYHSVGMACPPAAFDPEPTPEPTPPARPSSRFAAALQSFTKLFCRNGST